MSKSQRKVKVVIIGGGISGIGVAQKLCESGIRDFILLEAQNVLGGRISSIPHGKHFLEYGAHWIHGEDGNVVYGFGKENFLIEDELSLKQTGFGETIFIRENGSIIPDEYSEEFSFLMANLTEEAENSDLPTYKGSVGSYYEQKFKERNKWGQMGIEMLNWYSRLNCCIEGTNSWFDVSGIGSCAYEECPGNQYVNWSNGYEKLIKKLEESVPSSNIQLNSPVRKIYWKAPINSFTEIELVSGERIKTDHVVITTSLGVLKAKHEEMFEPMLPLLKVHAIEGLEMGTVDKIYLEFSTRWWKDDCDGFNFLHNEPCHSFNVQNWEMGIFGFYEVYKNPKMLCGWLSGEAAKAMEECSLEEVRRRCVKLLKFYLGSRYEIPEIIWCDRSKWFTNPYFCGSYSHHPHKADAMNVSAKDLASPILNNTGCPILCFAGEATHECYFSTVHGALESGWREAKRIIEYQSHMNVVKIYSSPKREYFEVVIVGAGAAGLCAARELEANGFNSLLLLEASDRIGGRINTIYFSPGKCLEFGAQWIHGQHNNILYDIAAPRGLVSPYASLDGEGDFYTEEGAKISSALISTVMDFYEQVKEDSRQFMSLTLKKYPPSVGHYFKARFDEYLNNCEEDSPYVKHLKNCLFNWIIKWERVDNACDSMHQLSSLHFGLYLYCDGADNLNPKKGMSSIIKSIAGDVNAEIRLNAHVDRINHSSILKRKGAKLLRDNGREPVIITCRDGSIIECQHVIVTSALGYLKRHLDMFEPALPDYLSEAIRLLGFGTINKIFLEYEEPWWSKDCIGLHIVWSEDSQSIDNSKQQDMSDCWYKAILGFDFPYGNKSALCGWIGGLEAEFMETLSEEEIGDTCTWILRKFVNNDIPKPKTTFVSRWASDPLTFGSYSHRMTLSKQFYEGKCYADDLNRPVTAKCSNTEIPILVLAGEANSLNFYSTIHGAMESGMKQASHYINFKEKSLVNGKLQNKL